MNFFPLQLASSVALLVHMALGSAIVATVAVFTLFAVRHTRAAVRHWIALSYLVGCLLAPLVTVIYQERLISGLEVSPTVTSQARLVAATSVQDGPALDEEEGLAANYRRPSLSLLHVAAAIFSMAWVIGIGWATILWLARSHRQSQYLRRLSPVRDETICSLLLDLRNLLEIRRHVSILVSSHAPWPFTVGLVKPRVIVPTELLEPGNEPELKVALTHELAHIARYDVGIALLEGIARSVFWWNPLVERISANLSAAREELCDSIVLHHKGDGNAFAQYLIVSMERAANAKCAWGVGMSADHPATVERRIAHLLSGDNPHMKPVSNTLSFAIAAVAIASCLLGVHTTYAQGKLSFLEPTLLSTSINTPDGETGPELTADGLVMVFHSRRPGTFGETDIFEATRTSSDEPFGDAINAGTVINGGTRSGHPAISADGLTMYFSSTRSGGGSDDLFMATRDSRSSPWENVVSLGSGVNSRFRENAPSLSPDELTIYFSRSDISGNDNDIYFATRRSLNDAWSEAHALPDIVNTRFKDAQPSISPDGLSLFFNSDRPGGFGGFDIYVASRPSIDEPWTQVTNLGEVINSSGDDKTPFLTRDGAEFYFNSIRPNGLGGRDLYVAQVVPEPSTGMVLLITGIVGSSWLRPRRRRNVRDR